MQRPGGSGVRHPAQVGDAVHRGSGGDEHGAGDRGDQHRRPDQRAAGAQPRRAGPGGLRRLGVRPATGDDRGGGPRVPGIEGQGRGARRHLPRARRALVGLPGRHLQDQGLDCRGYVVRERRQVVVEVRERGGDRGLPVERPLPAERLVGHHAERVHVRPRRRGAPARLLGADVVDAAHDRAGQRERLEGVRPGDAEVDQHGPAVGGEQDVAGLEVAVHDPGLVGHLQRLGDLGDDRHDLVGGQPWALPQPAAQRLALDELHGDVRRGRTVTPAGCASP